MARRSTKTFCKKLKINSRKLESVMSWMSNEDLEDRANSPAQKMLYDAIEALRSVDYKLC